MSEKIFRALTLTMRAIRINKFGNENVLEFQSAIDIPAISKFMVLVKVKVAGVNPVDTYIRAGVMRNAPKLPYTPGKDGAGLVESVGEGVSRFKPGDRVFISGRKLGQFGTYAEYSLVPESDLFPLDECLSFEEGAAIGIPYFTAYRALVLKAKCTSGQTVLVHGASGAVGMATIQIAKNRGLKVIGTAGTDKGMALVKSTGADFVLNHKEINYLDKVMEITENVGVNIVIEMLANVNLDKDLDIIAPRGCVAIVGSRGVTQIDPRKTMLPELNVFGVALLSSSEDEWQSTSKSIVQGIRDGWVRPVIDKTYSLQKASDAHRDIIHSSGAKGKLLLAIEEA